MIAGLLMKASGWLIGWLTDDMADRFFSYLDNRAKHKLGRDKLGAEVTVETLRADRASRQAARDIVLAEQGWWVTAMIRPAFAWPIVIWSGAVVADSLFHFEWNVAALPPPLDEWAAWIVGAYFVTRPFEKVARGYFRSRQR
ncbi:hypothetical protein [Roseibium alexandrii]|uniref:hypothetical protein n=1 Tax=Roseibium alexandrii TaxID=388408 RepID=UPI00375085D4